MGEIALSPVYKNEVVSPIAMFDDAPKRELKVNVKQQQNLRNISALKRICSQMKKVKKVKVEEE